MASKKRGEIKVEIVYPEDPYWIEEIERRKAKWIFDRQREKYGDENLRIAYPIWIRTKELEATGLSYEEAREIAKKEYFDKPGAQALWYKKYGQGVKILSIKVLQSFIEEYKHLGVLLDKRFDELKEYNRKKEDK